MNHRAMFGMTCVLGAISLGCGGEAGPEADDEGELFTMTHVLLHGDGTYTMKVDWVTAAEQEAQREAMLERELAGGGRGDVGRASEALTALGEGACYGTSPNAIQMWDSTTADFSGNTLCLEDATGSPIQGEADLGNFPRVRSTWSGAVESYKATQWGNFYYPSGYDCGSECSTFAASSSHTRTQTTSCEESATHVRVGATCDPSF